MKKLVLVSVAASALSGCIVMGPSGVTPEMHEDFVSAAASIGCVMRDESDYQPVELQAGLTREQTLALVQHHLTWGTAEKLPGDQGVKLTTGACA
ncbi:hypothetical protein [Marimonas lutisalis]|uniref:hypothetical protein n=1 Tax=Marimonas lutisalis TaxID=2545756 RepID=UPI0010F97A55|nr:hypothetical protein [Marimonas lutisalis]